MVFNLFAKTTGFRFGLSNGLYFILELSPIIITSEILLYCFAYSKTCLYKFPLTSKIKNPRFGDEILIN